MILFRAVFIELIQPFSMTLVVMTGLLMMEKIYRLVNLVVDNRVNMNDVGWMTVYLVPQVLTITIPLAIIGGVFVTVVRQTSDSEVITMRATGKSLWSYALPFAAFATVIGSVSAVLSLWVAPIANGNFNDLQEQMVRWRAEEKLVPGELNYDFSGKVIRVGARASEKELTEIFIADRALKSSSPVILANTGWIEVDEDTKQAIFRLKDGEIVTPSADPQAFTTLKFDRLNYALEYHSANTVRVKKVESEPSAKLLRDMRDRSARPRARITPAVELFKRIASPLSCLAFALAAIPMAMVDPRSGKGASYLRAVFLVAGYHTVWVGFKGVVQGGDAPTIALLLPSLLIFCFGLLRLWQANTDRDSLLRLVWP